MAGAKRLKECTACPDRQTDPFIQLVNLARRAGQEPAYAGYRLTLGGDPPRDDQRATGKAFPVYREDIPCKVL